MMIGTSRITFRAACFCVLIVVAAWLAGCAGNGASSGGPPPTVPSKFAYQSTRSLDGSDAPNSFTTSNIWLASADGSNSNPLTKSMAQSSSSLDPSPSPDGTKIVFVSFAAIDGSDAGSDTANVWVVSADGTGLTPLTKITAEAAGSSFPTFSPDGSKIVFEAARAVDGSDAFGPSNIWVMNTDGSGATALTQLTAAFCENPVFSPDGTKIAFDSQRALDGSNASDGGGLNIWVMNADGTGATPLTRLTKAAAGLPAWSPDGTKIAFISQGALDGSDSNTTADAFNVWIVNANGGNATPLTKYTGSPGAFDPSWSPDGTKIYYDSNGALDGSNSGTAHGSGNIWSISPDGTGATPLTKLTANDVGNVGPVIPSPDGTMLVFESGRALDGSDAQNTNNTFNIWIMNADGSSPMPLTKLTAPKADSNVTHG